jgi:hypothetical protein
MKQPKPRNQFDLLRSHWHNGDWIWIANAFVKGKKLQACLCFFSNGIDKNVVNLYPTKDMRFYLKIVIPEPLLMMNAPMVIQYLELELIK